MRVENSGSGARHVCLVDVPQTPAHNEVNANPIAIDRIEAGSVGRCALRRCSEVIAASNRGAACTSADALLARNPLLRHNPAEHSSKDSANEHVRHQGGAHLHAGVGVLVRSEVGRELSPLELLKADRRRNLFGAVALRPSVTALVASPR
jgi:hypothetical protein